MGLAPAAAAQLLWQHTVGHAAEDETGEFMIAVPGGFVTLGKASGTTAQPDQALYLSKVDYSGDTLWTKRWPFRQVEIIYPRGLMADAAGNLVVSAITFTPPVPPTAPPPPSQGLLVKLTATGDTLWSRTVPSTGPSASALDVLVLGNDGSYVATGQLATLPALFKYSPAGVLLWTQVVPYSSTIQGYLQNMVAVPNGYLLVSAPQVFPRLRSKYITVNEQGAYQFERLGSLYYADRYQRDTQGNILAVGGGLTKLTLQGDSLWSYSYPQGTRTLNITRLVETPTGNYLAVGTRFNGLDDDIGLVLLNRNGTRLRDTLLVRFQANENVAGVALTPAGNYVVGGGTNRGQSARPDQLVFALRNWDRLLPTATRAPYSLAHLSAFPNPTADELTLQAPDAHPLAGPWALYDLRGRAVQAGTFPGLARCRISLAQQPPGIYLLRFTDEHYSVSQMLRLQKN
jgi:outer membrane protein assembly factor BamB